MGSGSGVWIPADETRALILWIANERELHGALDGCSLVNPSKL